MKNNYFKQLLITCLFLVMFFTTLHSQTRTVKGTVKDAGTDVAIPGANIVEKGTTNGTVTDLNGKYSLEVSDGSTLVISFLGMLTEEVTIANNSTVDVSMITDIMGLEDVIVIGYGTAKKSDLTGAVERVGGDELSEVASTSVDALLKGRSAGVQVLSNSGRPGEGAVVRIRGSGSVNANNDPLYVVDGLPVGSAGNLQQINPADIESIDVLKDASSTAIYGSRGANGVIIITTKKGTTGKPTIEVNSQTGFSSVKNSFDIIEDPYTYALLANEGRTNGGLTPEYIGADKNGTYYPSLEEIEDGTWSYKTYWPDVAYRTAISQNTNVAARGGNDKTLYSLSLGHLIQEGIAIGNDYERLIFNVNLDQKLMDNIRVGTNINLAYINNNKSEGGGYNRSPVFPVYDEEGNYMQIGLNDFYHPVASAEQILDRNKSFDLYATGYLEWNLFPFLKFRSNISSKYGNSVADYYEPRDYGWNGNQFNGFGKINNYQTNNLVTDNYFTYTKSLGLNDINVMAGMSYEQNVTRTSELRGKEFINDHLQNENLNTATIQEVDNSGVTSTLLSYMGRANYSYNDKYIATFTIRADGSSRFGENNKWAYFPSAALGWNLHNESFIQGLTPVSRLKLRASYGQSGEQAIPPYLTMDRLGDVKYYMGDWRTGFGPGIVYHADSQSRKFWEGIPNKDLKWETTTSFNMGVDLGLYQQRINLTFEYYNSITEDLLRRNSLPPSSGYDRLWINDGTVQNTGIEGVFNAVVISKSNFSWDVGFNIAANKNKVISLDQETFEYNGKTFLTPEATGEYIEKYRGHVNYLIEGEPMNVFYGYKTDGIIQSEEEGLGQGLTGNEAMPGEIKYLDITEDGVLDDIDRTVIGDPNPLFYYGINTAVTYKKFELNMLFTGTYKNDVFNIQRFELGSQRKQRWTEENPSDEFPSLREGRGYRTSGFFIEDGTHLTLQNVTLSYNTPLNKVSFMQSVRVYINLDNVYTFTKFSGYDPAVGLDGIYWGGYPKPRTATIGVNLIF